MEIPRILKSYTAWKTAAIVAALVVGLKALGAGWLWALAPVYALVVIFGGTVLMLWIQEQRSP